MICVIFLVEMSGRLAAVSKHTLAAAVRERFEFNFYVIPLLAEIAADFLVLGADHDTNLLSNKLFRRDQIWITEKNRYGATDLYSLAEYKVRNDASFKSDYIKGRYGAIPYIGNLNSLIDSHA